jgi:hypothetical protein
LALIFVVFILSLFLMLDVYNAKDTFNSLYENWENNIIVDIRINHGNTGCKSYEKSAIFF